jgi:rhodanese-related sulfurtransferase
MVRVKHSLQGVSKVSVNELKEMLNKPDITILDVRDVPDWNKSNTKIPNAIRESPDDINSWVEKYDKEQKLIVYCA